MTYIFFCPTRNFDTLDFIVVATVNGDSLHSIILKIVLYSRVSTSLNVRVHKYNVHVWPERDKIFIMAVVAAGRNFESEINDLTLLSHSSQIWIIQSIQFSHITVLILNLPMQSSESIWPSLNCIFFLCGPHQLELPFGAMQNWFPVPVQYRNKFLFGPNITDWPFIEIELTHPLIWILQKSPKHDEQSHQQFNIVTIIML